MFNKKRGKIIAAIFIICVIILIFKIPHVRTDGTQIGLNISDGNIIIHEDVVKENTLYDALVKIQSEKKMSFTGKTYSGLGFLVTSIGELQEGSGKYLIYYINGKEASVGVSSYVPKNGDVILWKLK
jgi:hypothetical protein